MQKTLAATLHDSPIRWLYTFRTTAVSVAGTLQALEYVQWFISNLSKTLTERCKDLFSHTNSTLAKTPLQHPPLPFSERMIALLGPQIHLGNCAEANH